MRNYIVIIILLFIVSSIYSQKTYSLEECIDIAYKSNRRIKQAELIKQKSDMELKHARCNFFPSINAELSHNRNYSSSSNSSSSSSSYTHYWGVNSVVQIFDGLKSIYEIKYRKNEVGISDFNLQYQKQLIRDEVTYSYVKILLNKELIEVASTQLKLTDSLLCQRKALLKQGRIGQGELLELYAQKANEEFQYTQAINNLLISKLELTQLLEIEYDSLFTVNEIDDVFINTDIYNYDSVYNNALKNRANIKSAELQVESSKINTALIRSRYFPNISAGVVAGENYLNKTANPFSTRVYVMATVPIFDKFETRNLLQKSKVQTKLADLDLLNDKMELYKAIEKAKYNLLATKSKFESALKSQNISLEAYEYMNSKFKGGRATVFELYQAKAN